MYRKSWENGQLAYLMGKYNQITKILAGFKSRDKAIKKEYGELKGYKELMGTLEQDKKKITESASILIDLDVKKLIYLFFLSWKMCKILENLAGFW